MEKDALAFHYRVELDKVRPYRYVVYFYIILNIIQFIILMILYFIRRITVPIVIIIIVYSSTQNPKLRVSI